MATMASTSNVPPLPSSLAQDALGRGGVHGDEGTSHSDTTNALLFCPVTWTHCSSLGFIPPRLIFPC